MRALGHYIQAKHRVVFGLLLCEGAAVDGIDYCPGIRELNALACAIRAAAPTSVYQPDASTVLFHFCGEQFGIFVGMPDEERPAETRRERCRWFLHSHLRPSNF